MGMIEHEKMEYETAVLVGLVTPQQDELKLSEYLDELEFLAQTAGARVGKSSTRPTPARSSAPESWRRSRPTSPTVRRWT